MKMENEVSDRIHKTLKKILKGGFLVLLGFIGVRILEFVINILLARSLGPTKYGLIILGLVFVEISTRILNFGLPTAATQYIARHKKQYHLGIIKSIFSILLPIILLFSFLIFLFSSFISINVFHSAELNIILKVFIIAIPFSTLMKVCIGFIRGYQKIKEKIIIEVSQMLLLMFVFSFFYFTGKLEALTVVVIWVLSFFISSMIALSYLMKNAKFSFNSLIKEKSYSKKDIIYYSFPVFLAGTLTILMGNIDNLMLGYFLNTNAIGIYNVAFKFAKLMVLPLFFFGYFYLPIATSLIYAKKTKSLKKIFQLINKWAIVLMIPFIFVFFIFSKDIISIVFGAKYVGASLALKILLGGYALFLLVGVSNETLKAGAHTKEFFISAVCAVIFNIVFNYFLIPPFGIIGAAIGTAFSFLILSLFYFFFILKLFKVSPISKSNVIQLFYSLVIFTFLFFLNNIITFGPIFLIILDIIIFYLLLLSFNFVFRTFEQEELDLFHLIKRKYLTLRTQND